MSYTMNGGSFIDSINDRGSEETRHINHIIRQGLIQFIALDYGILKSVRTLRKEIESINDPYLLGNANGNSQFSIGLPMLASIDLNSLFDLSNNQAEIRKFRSLAKILYRIYAQKYDWIKPANESWIDNVNDSVVVGPDPLSPRRIAIVRKTYGRHRTRISVVIDWSGEINPKMQIILEICPFQREGSSCPCGTLNQITIPLQEKKANNTVYAFTVQIYDDVNIATAYTNFRIAQLLHSIWAYPLLFPRRFYELSPNYKDIRQIVDNFPEQTDPRFLKGVEEARRNTRALQFINDLEEASSGIPLQDEIKEILKNIVLRIGNIPVPDPVKDNTYVDILVSDPRYDYYKDNNEIKIVDDLLLKRKPSVECPAGQHKDPTTGQCVDDPDADNIIRAVGLENIFHQLFDLVQDDSSGGFNLEIFNSIRDIWGRLFSLNAGTPDGINYIEKELPSIESSFKTIIPSTSQQDRFADELDNVMDYLRGAIRQERLIDLRNVLNNPLPSIFINTFRSLRGLDTQALATTDSWLKYDNDNWFDYLFVIWWILTYEQKFSEIPDFASGRQPPQGVNFDAMFPGSLGGPSLVLAGGPNQNIDQSNSSARLELEYATYERNLSSLDNQLGRPGGLIRLARSYGGLPI
jgi:hypothetical protein